MNIRKIPTYITDAVQNSSATGKAGPQEKSATGPAVSSDRVQLSKNYQDIAQAQKAAMGNNGIRTEKVQQIQFQLQNGTYQLDPGKIAGKMLDEII